MPRVSAFLYFQRAHIRMSIIMLYWLTNKRRRCSHSHCFNPLPFTFFVILLHCTLLSYYFLCLHFQLSVFLFYCWLPKCNHIKYMTMVINSFSILHFVCSFCSLLFVVRRVCSCIGSIHLNRYNFILLLLCICIYSGLSIHWISISHMPCPMPHAPCPYMSYMCNVHNTHHFDSFWVSLKKHTYGLSCFGLRLKWIHVHRLKSRKFRKIYQMKLTLFWWPENQAIANRQIHILFCFNGQKPFINMSNFNQINFSINFSFALLFRLHICTILCV